tara:strand:+ start:300 stop:950 length:651 start_codon:yes stop_codon:yes gene_type:complete
MLIPFKDLEPSTLEALLEDYVTREGTDNGGFTSLKDRKDKLLHLLEREEAFITYNIEHNQPCLIAKHEVPAEALKAYRAAKLASLEEPINEVAEEPKQINSVVVPQEPSEQSLAEEIESIKASIALPFPLGRTVMTQGIKAMLDSGKFQLQQLQELLYRHSVADFGGANDESVLANLCAITSDDQIRSLFSLSGHELYVETERGHTQTMVMFQNER